MKKNKIQNSKKAVLYVGAALMALSSQSYAQSSDDALINKLEQKGILSTEEAKELRAESLQDFNNSLTNNFNGAFGKMIGMPGWVTGYKLSGDFRGRFDDQIADNPAFNDRIRLRYRLRTGLTIDMKDNLQVGFRLGSGEASGVGSQASAGSPLSNNTTLTDDATKKMIYIDAAYAKWMAINDGTWMAAGTIGKMDQPFIATPMMFDPDYTPEGIAANFSYKINDKNVLLLNAAAFVLDEESTSSHDPLLYGGQLIWNANWTAKISSSLGVAAFDIVNNDMLTTANVPNINQGNTRTAAGNLIFNYNPVFVDGSVTYLLDSFPLYTGKFPIKLAAEYVNNPGASANNEGYWAGITFGKAGRKHAWDLSYRYEYLESDAWFEELVDDDNLAFYPSAPVGGATGVAGGTNVRGHLVKFDYAITDGLTFSLTAYINSLIHNPGPGTSDAAHLMADLMWKF